MSSLGRPNSILNRLGKKGIINAFIKDFGKDVYDYAIKLTEDQIKNAGTSTINAIKKQFPTLSFLKERIHGSHEAQSSSNNGIEATHTLTELNDLARGLIPHNTYVYYGPTKMGLNDHAMNQVRDRMEDLHFEDLLTDEEKEERAERIKELKKERMEEEQEKNEQEKKAREYMKEHNISRSQFDEIVRQKAMKNLMPPSSSSSPQASDDYEYEFDADFIPRKVRKTKPMEKIEEESSIDDEEYVLDDLLNAPGLVKATKEALDVFKNTKGQTRAVLNSLKKQNKIPEELRSFLENITGNDLRYTLKAISDDNAKNKNIVAYLDAQKDKKSKADIERLKKEKEDVENAAKEEADRLKKEKEDVENAAKEEADRLKKEKEDVEEAAKKDIKEEKERSHKRSANLSNLKKGMHAIESDLGDLTSKVEHIHDFFEKYSRALADTVGRHDIKRIVDEARKKELWKKDENEAIEELKKDPSKPTDEEAKKLWTLIKGHQMSDFVEKQKKMKAISRLDPETLALFDDDTRTQLVEYQNQRLRELQRMRDVKFMPPKHFKEYKKSVEIYDVNPMLFRGNGRRI